MGADWQSQWCNLCQQWTESGKRQVCKYLANHLVGIAIVASGLDCTSDDGSDADSTKSHGEVPKRTDKLPTISEEQGNEEILENLQTSQKPREADHIQAPEDINNPLQALSIYEMPDCAFCNSPTNLGCLCEAESLQNAVMLAEYCRMAEVMANARCVNFSLSLYLFLPSYIILTLTVWLLT